MANIRNPDFFASPVVNAAWLLWFCHVTWIGICQVDRKEISKIVFRPNFFEIGLFGLECIYSEENLDWCNQTQYDKSSDSLFGSYYPSILSCKSLCKPNEYWAPVDEIHQCLIFKWAAVTCYRSGTMIEIQNNAGVAMNNDFLVMSEVICQWFSRVTKSQMKIIRKSHRKWTKNCYSQ